MLLLLILKWTHQRKISQLCFGLQNQIVKQTLKMYLILNKKCCPAIEEPIFFWPNMAEIVGLLWVKMYKQTGSVVHVLNSCTGVPLQMAWHWTILSIIQLFIFRRLSVIEGCFRFFKTFIKKYSFAIVSSRFCSIGSNLAIVFF